MSSYQNLIKFYRDCYALDNSNFGIQNVLSTGVTNRLMLKTEKFVAGEWPTSQINFGTGDKLFQAMQVYKKEKELQCCFYFLNFKVSTPRGDKKVITPLYVFKPYVFRKNKNYFLGNDHASVNINPFALRMLSSLSGVSTSILSESFPIDFLTTDLKSKLSIIFTELFSKIDIDLHLSGTNITLLKDLKQYQRFRLTLIPGAMIGLFKKGAASLGVLEELETMSKRKATSAPLNSILNNKSSKRSNNRNSKIIVPINLNLEQEKIVRNYPLFNNLIVSGPPGTGKTLSIGALICDAVIKGKSVLIATKNEEPLDVIERMLKDKFEFSNIFLRGGSKSNRAKISKRLKAIKKEVKERNYDSRSISYLRNQIRLGQNKATSTKRKIEKAKNLSYKIADLIDESSESFFKNLHLEISKYRKRNLELNDLLSEKHQVLGATNELIFEYMRERIYFFLSKYTWKRWDAFDQILKTLTTRNKTQRAAKIADLDILSTNSIKQLINKYEIKQAHQSKLNYRTNSILDLCIASSNFADQFVQLKEHYRSYPEMIQFSNSRFYNDTLRAFQLPRKVNKSLSLSAFRMHGERSRNGVNKKEAFEVFVQIKNIILSQRGLQKDLVQSIGVLSPFRAQVNHLQKEITKSFSNEDLERHQIVVGTPYAFQGDEKDIMILSFAMDNKSLRGSQYLESEGVFNVAITRARQRQIVLYSFNHKKLSETSILRNYINYLKVNHHRVKSYTPNKPKNRFVKGLHTWLLSIPRIKVIFNHNLNVFELDFLILKGRRKIFIDLVGFEGGTHPMLSEAKYDLLYRLDVEIYILTYRSWKENQDSAKGDIWNFIHNKRSSRS